MANGRRAKITAKIDLGKGRKATFKASGSTKVAEDLLAAGKDAVLLRGLIKS